MISVEQYYKILELEPGATLEEVRQGYKDLALVWHPDRFLNHPRLQQKAHKKLQEINEAHEKLRSTLRIAVEIAAQAQPEPKKTPPVDSPASGKNCYTQSDDKQKAESSWEYNCDDRPFVNFRSKPKDVQGWLD